MTGPRTHAGVSIRPAPGLPTSVRADVPLDVLARGALYGASDDFERVLIDLVPTSRLPVFVWVGRHDLARLLEW